VSIKKLRSITKIKTITLTPIKNPVMPNLFKKDLKKLFLIGELEI
jgi:hypothetical protein